MPELHRLTQKSTGQVVELTDDEFADWQEANERALEDLSTESKPTQQGENAMNGDEGNDTPQTNVTVNVDENDHSKESYRTETEPSEPTEVSVTDGQGETTTVSVDTDSSGD